MRKSYGWTHRLYFLIFCNGFVNACGYIYSRTYLLHGACWDQGSEKLWDPPTSFLQSLELWGLVTRPGLSLHILDMWAERNHTQCTISPSVDLICQPHLGRNSTTEMASCPFRYLLPIIIWRSCLLNEAVGLSRIVLLIQIADSFPGLLTSSSIWEPWIGDARNWVCDLSACQADYGPSLL